jgi:hypothetical protein
MEIGPLTEMMGGENVEPPILAIVNSDSRGVEKSYRREIS